ncbi:hypothetical protein U1Q18_041723 [Sarracenia purpurea var. burkii]
MWNTLIRALANTSSPCEAVHLHIKMRRLGVASESELELAGQKFPGTVTVRLTASGLAPADCCLCRSSSWPQYSCVLGSYVKPIADRRVATKHSAVVEEQRIQDHDYVKKPIAKESLEDEELKAAFEKWKYKSKPVRNYYFVKT